MLQEGPAIGIGTETRNRKRAPQRRPVGKDFIDTNN
jgi:hypothetical protein